MTSERDLIEAMGSEPPILAGSRKAPDRRDVSLRWLSGTFLTGIASSALMGFALFAALDGREQLALPGQALAAVDVATASGQAQKGGRLAASQPRAKPVDRSVMEVSTVVHEGDHDVVRRRPYALFKMSLAANHTTDISYPRFNPLTIVASGKTDPAPATSTGQIYGAQVDSEVSLKSVDFPIGKTSLRYAASLDAREAERIARKDADALTSPTMQLASLYLPVSPAANRNSPFVRFEASGNARVTAENVSVTPMNNLDIADANFGDDIIPFRTDETITEAMTAGGFGKPEATEVSEALARLLESDSLSQGDVLRLGIEQADGDVRIMRASVYANGNHIVTVARNDRGRFVIGAQPPPSAAVAHAFDDTPVPTIVERDLPDLYDGIYRAGLSYGMSETMIARVIRLLAPVVDFKAEMKPSDRLEVFFSSPDSDGRATAGSQLLFLDANIDGKETRLYRFQDKKGEVDYYNSEGKSIHPFLLRDPVPNGVFTSPFGMRRHPILGYKRMHWGCDWAAPRGTPILSVGDGVVVKAGWDSGGYGNQTIISYGNGYESSYNHQSAIAKGIRPGAHVRQGQVIGYVGTTGESTGPHLHYEIIVNGTKVDPMKVRLPERKPLKGEALLAFEHERKRIDSLLENTGKPASAEVASR